MCLSVRTPGQVLDKMAADPQYGQATRTQ